MAAPGYDMYYLNVMAGPGAERAWKISDHPDQTWVRGTWADQPIDPRLTDAERHSLITGTSTVQPDRRPGDW